MKRVCGLDVHKDNAFVCILGENGEKIEFKTGVLTVELDSFRDRLVELGVGEVAMESTAVYWMPIWRILESDFKLYLVNPLSIKQLPGRKSDVKDAEWIATCLQKGLIRGSFVPPLAVQQLRQYNRRLFDLNKQAVYVQNKMDAALQRCNIRISNYVSTVDSKGYRTVVKMLSQGITDPEVLVGALHGRTVNKHGREVLVGALTGVINDTDIDIISQLMEEIELLQRHKDEAQQKMTELCRQWFPQELENLQTIPGVKERSATSIIAETGTDMSKFQTPKHLVSWVGLRPRNEESAGKIKSRRIVHGNKFMRKTMIECGWAAPRTKGSFYSAFYQRQTIGRRKNKMKVQVAIARKLLTVVWHVLHDGCPYVPYKDLSTQGTL